MRNSKDASRAQPRSKAVPVLSAAGLTLSLASGPAAASLGGTAHIATPGVQEPLLHKALLQEEEVSEVSLATFHVFDKENGSMPRRRLRFAQAGAACAGCGGCGCACGSGLYNSYTPPGLYYNYTPPGFGEPAYGPRAEPIHPTRKRRLDRRYDRP
jgi:hypothetical protein